MEAPDLALTRLVADKFNINSAGKTPQSKKRESFEKKFSSRMVPHALTFDESQILLDQNPNIFSKTHMDINIKSGVSAKCKFSPLKSIENTICSPYTEKNPYLWRIENDTRMRSPKFEFSNNLRTMENKENILEMSETNINHLKMGGHDRNYLHSSEDNVDGTIFGRRGPYRRKDDLLKNINVQYFSSNNGRTPSKFSVVRDRLSPYSIPRRCTKNISESSLQDYTSRDSGFENSSSFDTSSKLSNIDSHCQTSMERFDDYEMDDPVTHFEVEKSTHTSDFDFHTLHDLEEEFDTVDTTIGASCSKYEIISTDSPDICSSSNRVNTIIAQDFQFGSPIGDLETSENFDIAPKISRRMPIRSETTRMLNFDTETTSTSFKFIPPKMLPPKKLETSSPCRSDSQKTPSYNFFSIGTKSNNTWGNNFDKNIFDSTSSNKHDDDSNKISCDIDSNKSMRVDSGISGGSVSPFVSPFRNLDDDNHLNNRAELKSGRSDLISRARPSRLFNSASSSSMESGCISEMEESMFDLDEQCQDLNYDMSSTISSSIQSLIRGEIQCGTESTPSRLGEKLTSVESVNKTPLFRRCLSLQPEGNSVERVRTALFQSPSRPRKRTEISDNGLIVPKRRRSQISQSSCETSRPVLQRTISDNEATIKVALSKAYSEPDLIGDFSQPYSLPLTGSQHRDLKAISSSTLASLMDGGFKHINSFKVIDCRYPYEFEGGHIVGAQNLYTEELVQNHLLNNIRKSPAKSSSNRDIVIFHCEFSSKRGPELCRFLRRADRGMNEYPSLTYPELYVLRDGYHGFHIQHRHLCRPTPGAYISMLDPRFTSSLRLHRSATSRRTLK